MDSNDSKENQEKYWQLLYSATDDYRKESQKDFSARWAAWKLDLSEVEKYEVIGAILARIVTLGVEFSYSPMAWNHNLSPLILRSITDAYISMAWIFKDPLTRARQFIEFGLGQTKLEVEHRKMQIEKDGGNPKDDPVVMAKEKWINSQQYTFLTNVNVGNWSGLSTRKMAEEADCIDFYNYVYTPFSSATHNMWNHLARFNLQYCANPLHNFHRIPVVTDLPSDIGDMLLAAKYVDKSFALFDANTGVNVQKSNAFSNLKERVSGIRIYRS
ncbi:MAG: hypothetical protein KIT70_03325 [Anaerolineales bacterium]|nr:MAG: hypothetical protein KIT70_03325 [Anaerolineales bacterium]